jgi:hypothetical protein
MNLAEELAAAYERGRRDAFLESSSIAEGYGSDNAGRRVANRIAGKLRERGGGDLTAGTLGLSGVRLLTPCECAALGLPAGSVGG